VNEPTLDSLRKRILLFYFAGGINLFMAVYVVSAGAGTAAASTLVTIALLFVAFAILNFYLARKLRTRWSQLARQGQGQGQAKPEAANDVNKSS
jgi:hypothetical protein